MLNDLIQDESCIQITPSKLVTWILCYFRKADFSNCRQAIIQAHFDSRKYLKQAVSSKSSPEELAGVLESVLAKLKMENPGNGVPRRRKQKPRPTELSTASVGPDSESLDLPLDK
jgi:hypothetical protein